MAGFSARTASLRRKGEIMAAAVGLDGGLLDAVANANYKTLAEGPIIDAQSERKRIGGILEASLGNIVGTLTTSDQSLPQAIASQVEQGGALAQTVTQLSSALAAAMQILAAANAGGTVPAK
jgi:hypothetical protein